MQQMFYIILGLPPFFAAIAITRCLSNNLLHWLNRLTALIVTGAFVYMTMVTGVVTRNLEQALIISYEAMQEPKIVMAVGA